MKTTVITHQANLKLWASRVSDQKSSGLLVDDWCTQYCPNNCSGNGTNTG